MFSIGEFKGNPVINLKRSEDDRYGFSFGLSKAKLLLEHIEDVRKFVAEHDKEKPKDSPEQS